MRKPTTIPRTVRGDHKPPKDVEPILNERSYARLRKLGVMGWFDELRRLYELSVQHNLNLHADDPKVERRNIAGRTRIFLPGAPLAQLVTPVSHDVRIPTYLLPALVINISAPDEIVRTQFEKALAQARKQFPVAFSKPGPYALNSLFEMRTFLSWRNARIVQLAELLTWNAQRKARGLRRYPEHVLGGWLGLQDKTATSRAKGTLKKALASLPALAAQIKYDHDLGRVTDMRDEAQRAIDPDLLEIAARWAEGM
jgi:hypothetical protein